ncbi:hypothetical protein F2Q69_00019141 [Brassica cretica]|uniref:Secreted protein n=1 Tax=Brassica cretica TaxID=69181 RepID=A0A8S9Q9R4_BRACR|nr:hypothetical protein F2Q69_00019141 [Brassica cretica]
MNHLSAMEVISCWFLSSILSGAIQKSLSHSLPEAATRSSSLEEEDWKKQKMAKTGDCFQVGVGECVTEKIHLNGGEANSKETTSENPRRRRLLDG